MKYLKHFFSLSLITLMICLFGISNDAVAQNNTGSSWQDYIKQATDYFTGAEDAPKVYNVRGRKVSVSVQDVSLAEKALLATFTKSGQKNLQNVGNYASAAAAAKDLEVEDIAFAPDEKTGKFYLSFSVPEEDDTEIYVIDVTGKEIYSESVDEFTGTYETPIDVPVTADATYFLKIVQGFSLTNKKLVVN